MRTARNTDCGKRAGWDGRTGKWQGRSFPRPAISGCHIKTHQWWAIILIELPIKRPLILKHICPINLITSKVIQDHKTKFKIKLFIFNAPKIQRLDNSLCWSDEEQESKLPILKCVQSIIKSLKMWPLFWKGILRLMDGMKCDSVGIRIESGWVDEMSGSRNELMQEN